MDGDALEAAYDRLWQLLWDCCDQPRPLVVRSIVSDLSGFDVRITVVICENCAAPH